MIKIVKELDRLLFLYAPDRGEVDWIDETLDKDGEISIFRRFTFTPDQEVKSTQRYSHLDNRVFILGTRVDNYYQINQDILGLKYDLLLHTDMPITDKTFLATGRISIFFQIDQLINEQIVVGGDKENAIPLPDFNRLIHLFPTKTTLLHFSNARIAGILKEYFDTMPDAQKKLEEHFTRQGKLADRMAKKDTISPVISVNPLREYELDKYRYILESVEEMLQTTDEYSEGDWQKKMIEFILLIFPKYVAILENLHIRDYYSKPRSISNRYIDLTLVDANGNIDIIEIKKPFAASILSTSKYRDNYTPKKELAGSVMQVEKYLFHLNKWGVQGEKEINQKRSSELPNNMQIKITNPKGMIILGRDADFDDEQRFDFEIIKRKYANIMDIMTYDDLLQRLKNIIAKFEVK